MTMKSTLIDLQTEETAFVCKLEGGKRFTSRMASLGFTPGAPVQLVRKGRSGPVLVTVRGAEVALGRYEAEGVLVTKRKLECEETPERSRRADETIVALAGQPNVGKSTVFNALTRMNQHVGNWTGKTVELMSGVVESPKRAFTLVDLPGTYSLTAASEEERITRDFILTEKPTLVVAVVDAAILERSLYLLAELLLMPAPVLLALNMMDVAAQEGIRIEPEVLQSALGIPVVPMSAGRGKGMDELRQTIERMVLGELTFQPRRPSLPKEHQHVVMEIETKLMPYLPESLPCDWTALKLLEGDEELADRIQRLIPANLWEEIHALLYAHEDAILEIAGERYEWIARMLRAAVVKPPASRMNLTRRLDAWFTHPVWGLLTLALVLGAVFAVTYALGTPLQTWLGGGVAQLAALVRANALNLPVWAREFAAGGLLGGVGMVLTFLPILAVFYLALGFLEDSGYMARAAYLADRWMHRIGLHGKSFLPLLLGFGCNVPAVLGTRIIESRRARFLTILLIPFIPCTARLAVVAVLAPIFFGGNAIWISWGLVGANLVLLMAIGWLLHRFVFGDEHVAFIMELPLYHAPNLRTIGMNAWRNLLEFIRKAGGVILIASVVIWFLSYLPAGNLETSWLAVFGRALEPVGAWMGLPWPVLLALLTSVVAKENTIATLGILYGSVAGLSAILAPAAGLSLLVFQVLFIPCIGTVAAIRQETKSVGWTLLSVGLMLVLAFGLAVLVYQAGR